MKYISLLKLGILVISGAYLQGITFNISLANLADLDIAVAKNPISSMPIGSEFMNPALGTVAHYSFMLNSNGSVSLWHALFHPALAMTFLMPENRINLSLLETNPFTLELLEEEIALILREEVSEVYVRVRQRTYAWNSKTNRPQLYSYNLLKNDLYSVNAVITINASGLIDPTKLATVPPNLTDIYTVAFGIVT